MTSGLQQLISIALEAILAGLVWLLHRRADAARRRLIALETEHGLMKKRFEAATAGLHLRLLHAEWQLRQAPARPQLVSAGHVEPRAVDPGERSNAASAGRRNASHSRGELSRGEMDLRQKIQQLTTVDSR